ncbi:MAG: hypothetical protein ACXW3S_11800 [Rhodoplanes sp.]
MQAQLARVLASPDFDAPERNRRFLRYVVEETLAGRGDRIKAYGIAVAVFDRDGSFDAQSDPIVRIEASRLRRSLERYYLLAGGNDPVRIEIPKGAYVPAFHRQSGCATGGAPEPPSVPPAPLLGWLPRLPRGSPGIVLMSAVVCAVLLGGLVTLPALLWPDAPSPLTEEAMQDLRQGPAILVVPFQDESEGAAHPALSQGFTRELVAGLTRFSDLFVFGPETAFRYGNTADPPGTAVDMDVDFILTGGVAVSSDRFRVTASLIEAGSGRYLWSGRFDGDLAAAEIIQVRDDLADQVVRELAQPYGVIFSTKAREIEGKRPQSLTSYECVLRFYQYWKTYDAQLYDPVRECLERAIVADADYADAFASLAFVYADAYRFNRDRATISPDPLARALRLARRAVELAPDSTHSYHALHLVYWLMNDVERSLEAAKTGLALNPNDTALMADLGLRYCIRAQWDKGLPLVRQAYARNPGQSGQYRIALFLHHYINGEYEAALAEARKVEARGIIYNHVVLAMAYAQVGQRREAAAEIDQIVAIDPAYDNHAIADLQKRNLHPDLIKTVIDGLRDAGLAVSGSLSREDPQASAEEST